MLLLVERWQHFRYIQLVDHTCISLDLSSQGAEIQAFKRVAKI